MPYNPETMPVMDNKDFHTLCNEIVTFLASGAHWHLKAANGSRRNMCRGLGRLHDCEAKEDFCKLVKFEKIVGDKLGYQPIIDMAQVTNAESYMMPDMSAFKSSFTVWENVEKQFIEVLNKAVHASRMIDIQIYNEIICMLESVQNEVMRLRMIKESFEFGGWNAHDISVKSKWIHEYMENEHKHGDFNINIG